MVEQPADLWRGEIRIDDEPGARCGKLAEPRLLPPLAYICRTAVLPDDRIMDRVAGRALPQDRRLALIGNAEYRDRAVRRGHHFTAGRKDAAPDLFGIVFDPSRSRVMLRQLGLGGGARPAGCVEQDRPGARRALVDRQNIGVAAHNVSPRLG